MKSSSIFLLLLYFTCTVLNGVVKSLLVDAEAKKVSIVQDNQDNRLPEVEGRTIVMILIKVPPFFTILLII